MRIIIETPKWSFRKIEKRNDGFQKVFLSPFPTPFNYGYIDGSKGEDGTPLDAIVLGNRLKTGMVLKLGIIGRAKFIDDNKRDDKFIASMDRQKHEFSIRLFFNFYAFAKLIQGFFQKHRWTYNSFEGLEWFSNIKYEIEEIPHLNQFFPKD